MIARFIFAGLLAAVSALAQEKSASKPQLPDAAGKATTVRICSQCHGADIVLGRPNSEDGWSAIVADMVERGAKGSDDELYEVVQYLTKNIRALPKINVNKATAKELEDGLAISGQEAAAIVEARQKSPFQSFDDLKKVPGLDAAKLALKRHRLAY